MCNLTIDVSVNIIKLTNDLKDNNLGTKITQQILMQSEHMGAKDFFKPPKKLSNKN